MSKLRYFYEQAAQPLNQSLETDVCVYGGNAAGVVATLQAARLGMRVVLIEPSLHWGGLTSGGLSCTDFGRKQAIGGMSLEFYKRVGKKYGEETNWHFEPHIAEQVLEEMLAEAAGLTEVKTFKPQFLKSVEKSGPRIDRITMLSGLSVRAKMFIDCSYEGDLMAQAGVSYATGRESNSVYGETLNGAQVRHTHQFDFPVSPYVIENDPSSGVLPGVEPKAPETGKGDHRIQAYNFRLCLTQEKGNLIPFEKPEGYNPKMFELLARYFRHPWKQWNQKFDPLAGNKVDKNNHGAVSTDFIGGNYAWPDGDYATREKVFQAHVLWQKGFMYFMGNDPSVPADVREWWNTWGLCRDEFTQTGGWSHQLYIREARRMVGDYVLTEQDCRRQRRAPEVIGMGSYNMDSHNCQRFVKADGTVSNEGDVQFELHTGPYSIGYRCIVPKRGECENLVVPVCASSSHIAYGSVRMEPVFMVLGQSSAVAAWAAIQGKTSVQDVSYVPLKDKLTGLGQVLDL